MSIIATLLSQPIQMQRLAAAVRDRHQLLECADWAALTRACERAPVRVAVVDLYVGGPPNFEGLRQLKQRLPRLTIVAYVAMAEDRAHDLFDAGRAGIEGLVILGADDSPRVLLGVVEKSETKSLAGFVRRSFDGADPLVVDAILLAVTRAQERLSPASLARLLAQPRRAVTRRLADEGFPAPQRLLTWGRLIVAAHMLEDAHRSADRIATSLDFPSGSAFRNTCQRYLHATPGEIRARGGANYVMRSMLRHVNARVTHATVPRRPSAARSPALAI